MISRRDFLKLAGGAAAGAASVGLLTAAASSCGRGTTAASGPDEEETTTALGPGGETPQAPREVGSKAHRGRLLARPGPPTSDATAPSTGLRPLGLGSERNALLYIPKGYRATEEGAPLALVLHGSRSDAIRGLSPFLGPAEEAGLVLLAPDSRDPRDWDFVFPGYYGPDVEFIDRALERTFGRLAVDPGRLAVAGFSDGASYALSLGLTNGDLFTHVIAFSAGLAEPVVRRGKPFIFVSHGTRDEVLPIKNTSRRFVPQLEREGYEVRYREFDGGHTVPPGIAHEAFDWFVAKRGGGTGRE
jgi:phospholipase/carboxylesterase